MLKSVFVRVWLDHVLVVDKNFSGNEDSKNQLLKEGRKGSEWKTYWVISFCICFSFQPLAQIPWLDGSWVSPGIKNTKKLRTSILTMTTTHYGVIDFVCVAKRRDQRTQNQ